jgi:hypothetical protein
MAGYSSRSQASKLGLKPEYRIAVVNRPDGWDFEEPLGDPLDAGGPVDAADATSTADVTANVTADVIVAFFEVAAEIPVQLPALAERVYPAGAIWLAWPRRATGHKSDITDNVIREYALPLGLVDVKVAAIDDDWSGLRLVWRVENRRERASDRIRRRG